MKRLAFLLALLPGMAFAQVPGSDAYRVISPAQILPYTSASTVITAPFFGRLVRLTCTTSCFVTFFEGDSTVASAPAVTTVTGHYLPADRPTEFIVNSGDVVRVIRSTHDGKLMVEEISK
jgi:hypothetical protein